MGSGMVVEELPVVHDVTSEQSTVASAVADPRKVKTRVVGHAKLTVVEVEPAQVVATAMGGVAKTRDVTSGQLTVKTPVDAGKVTVVTVSPGTVMALLRGV